MKSIKGTISTSALAAAIGVVAFSGVAIAHASPQNEATTPTAAVTSASPAADVAPALLPPAPAPALTAEEEKVADPEARKSLLAINQRIGELEAAKTTTPDSDYSQEIIDLLKTAVDLKGTIVALATGNIAIFDPTTIAARVELFITISTTIHTAVSTLYNKVSPTHVQLGIGTTKAVLVLVNLTATKQRLAQAQQELKQLLAKVSTYPDLKPEDKATIYVKAKLGRTITQTRLDRDKNVLGKKDFATYNELNSSITHAVGVWFDPGASVDTVGKEMSALRSAYKTAASSPK